MKRSIHVLIGGYYGFYNVGDDAVLAGIIAGLKKRLDHPRLTVLSNDPEHTEKQFGLEAVNRWQLPAIIRAMRRSDLVILGGGTLLQDRTSPRSPLYYLGLTTIALLLKKPVFFLGQGFGPIIHPFSQWMIRRVVNRIDGAIMRDKASADELIRCGVNQTPVLVAADPALMLDPQTADKKRGEALLKAAGIPLHTPRVFVAVRHWKTDHPYQHILARVLDDVAEWGYTIVFVAMQHTQDIEPARAIAGYMQGKAFVMEQKLKYDQILDLFSTGEALFGMRLHAIIFAALINLPFVPLSYDPKIDRFVKTLGLEQAFPIDALDTETLIAYTRALFQNLPERRSFLKARMPQTVQLAEEGMDVLIELYNKKMAKGKNHV
ncbi:MAG: Polysaccharide pyruvyl transferase [Candidatus Carbobacillus altaicus]|uniref:Polysaccharide pyruvyl transferase n=1 Tax=Candidatus Carbonibacillus altaicus TaxID=2163959 RepID=A0A2R6Y4E6_9BACL|nr:MAG: Polysaccharide pyruvyl transferase [Candidatus Carbobacillus altaicus]